MGLTCSVLGHQYGERERTESRNEQGSEVIVTVQEIETCTRCGHEKVVTESKEVTAAHDGPAAEPPSEPEPTPDPIPAETTPMDEAAPEVADNGEDDGIILTAENEPSDGETTDVDAALDDGDGPAAWPAVEESDENESDAGQPDWPEQTANDEGYDAVVGEPDDYGDEIIEASPSPAGNKVETTEGTGFAKAGPIGSPNDPPAAEVHIEYFCPRCSWTAKSLTASVRAGDICPGCRAGYIAERDE